MDFSVWLRREAAGSASLQQGGAGGWEPVMSDVISIFLTISNACAKTRHYCCNALTRDLPAASRHFGKPHSAENVFMLLELYCVQLLEIN